jgi:predicted acylesterase/phospholipase RssA
MATTDRLALVFSGGGAKGAFGVGVLSHFVEAFPTLRWHVVAGTSTGALIAPLAALGARDRGALGVLREMYLGARQKKIISSNFGFPTILKAVVDLPEGVYNFRPLKELVKEVMDDARLAQLAASDVACVLNAVNLQTGHLVLCTQDAHRERIERWFIDRGEAQVSFLGYDRFRRAMRASSAVPAAVDPIGEKNALGDEEQLVDGGVLDIAPLRAAIAAGATHVVTVLMSPRLSSADAKYRDNLLQVATRSVDLLTDEILRNDVETAELVTRLHELAILLAASNVPLPAWLEKYRARVPLELATVEPPLPLGDTFDFDGDKRRGWPDEPVDDSRDKVNIMQARMECGERTAAKAIAAKPELRAILERFAAT